MRRMGSVVALALIGASACRDGAENGAVVTADSAGITIVRNVRPPRDTVRVTTPDVRIGHDEAKTESVFREVHDVEFAPSGGIIVVDGGTRVVLLDSTGNAPRAIGRSGQGPGEYRGVRWALVRGDTIALWDVRKRQMLFFRETGESLGELAMADNTEGRTIRPFADGWLDEGETGQYEDTAAARGFILRRGADGTVRDTIIARYPIPEIGWQITDPKTGYGSMVNPPALGISPAWSSDGTRIVRASATLPRVHVHGRDGRLERIIELPYRPGPPSDADRDAFIATLADRYGMPAEAAARSRQSTRFTDTIPVITRVILADDGVIWVGGFAATEPFDFVGPAWDVLDDDGRIVRRVEFPVGFTLHDVRGRRALGVRTLESGVSTVEVYHLP